MAKQHVGSNKSNDSCRIGNNSEEIEHAQLSATAQKQVYNIYVGVEQNGNKSPR